MGFHFGLDVCTLHVNTFAFKKFVVRFNLLAFPAPNLHFAKLNKNFIRSHVFVLYHRDDRRCHPELCAGRNQNKCQTSWWQGLGARISPTCDTWSRADVLRPIGAIWFLICSMLVLPTWISVKLICRWWMNNGVIESSVQCDASTYSYYACACEMARIIITAPSQPRLSLQIGLYSRMLIVR